MPEATTNDSALIDSPRSRSWRCSDCKVSVSFAADRAPDQPDGWVKKSNKWVCLRCQRERVMDMAASGQGADGWASRREALMEFELLRTPNESDVVIAKRANCSTGHVRKARQNLKNAGKLPKSNRSKAA
jgi:hypothetical protein